MRTQQTVLALVVTVSLVAMSSQKTWSQGADPFAPAQSDDDPFGGEKIDDPFGGPSGKPRISTRRQSANQQTIATGQQTARVGSKNAIDVVSVGESETDQRIHSTLQDETSQNFADTPLDEAVRVLSDSHDIPMLIDKVALEEIGLTADTPVDISLRRVSLHSFFRLMLRDLDLTYMVKDEVLQVTTLESAEQNLETRMYHFPELLAAKTDKVVAALQSAVEPDTWEALGGPSMISTIDHVWIVSTRSDVHQDVEDFLDILIYMYEKE